MGELRRLDPVVVSERWKRLGSTFKVAPFVNKVNLKTIYNTDLSKTALGDLFSLAGETLHGGVSYSDRRINEGLEQILGISPFTAALLRVIALDSEKGDRRELRDCIVSPKRVVGPEYSTLETITASLQGLCRSEWEVLRKRGEQYASLDHHDTYQVMMEKAIRGLRGEVRRPMKSVEWTKAAMGYVINTSDAEKMGSFNYAPGLIAWGSSVGTYFQISAQAREPYREMFLDMLTLSQTPHLVR